MTISAPSSAMRLSEAPIVPLRHPLRWLTAALMLLVLAMLIHGLVTNEAFGWATVGEYLFNASVMAGLQTTLVLTVIAMSIGLVLGTVLALMRQSQNPVLKTAAGGYIWFFRGTPLLVQLIFWFNLSSLLPNITLGLPGLTPFFSAPTNDVFSVWTAAIVAFGLNEAAYMAEIVRGGLVSVDKGQAEAARTLGMGGFLTLRRIVLPQCMRIILPPTGNQVIGMLKYTSLVSVIALPDLLYSAQLIYSQNFQTIPLLMVACLWYLLITTILTMGQSLLEKRLGRGYAATRRTKRRPAYWSSKSEAVMTAPEGEEKK